MVRLLQATVAALAIVAGAVWIWAAAATDPIHVANEEANAIFSGGDLRTALERYRELQRRQPLPVLSVNAGNTLYRLDDFSRALVDHQAALEKAEGKVRSVAFYDRGNTLFRLGRIEDARESYKDSLRLDPGFMDAKINLEITLRLLAARRPPNGEGQQGAPKPGEPGADAQSGQPGEQQSQPGRPGEQGRPGIDPNASGNDAGNVANAPPSLGKAVDEFRRNLTTDEALRLLDALRAQERGIQTLLDGRQPTSGRQEPLY